MLFKAIAEIFDYHRGTIEKGSLWVIDRTQVQFNRAGVVCTSDVKLKAVDRNEWVTVSSSIFTLFFREYERPVKYRNRRLVNQPQG